MEKLIYNVRQIFGEYLTSKGCSFYNIPEYQRGYKWTAANVIQLLEDLKNFKKNDNDQFYCIQNITITKQKHKDSWCMNVIDGQQRLTTLFILLSYLQRNMKDKIISPSANILKYSIRETSDKFLCDSILTGIIWDNAIDTNAAHTKDQFYIMAVADAIQEWFRENKLETKTVLDDLVLIVNEVRPGDEETVFASLNGGKVDLDGADLVRAILITRAAKQKYPSIISREQLRQIANDDIDLNIDISVSSRGKINEFRVKLGVEIDEMNKWWAQNKVKDYFEQLLPNKISKNKAFKYSQYPIDLLYYAFYEAYKTKLSNSNEGESLDLRVFENGIDLNGQSGDDHLEFYTAVREFHLTMMDWYNHDEIYNLIGYLMYNFKGSKISFELLWNIWLESESKDDFIYRLKELIKEQIALPFYNNDTKDEENTLKNALDELRSSILNLQYDWYNNDFTLKFLPLVDILPIEKNVKTQTKVILSRITDPKYFRCNGEDKEHVRSQKRIIDESLPEDQKASMMEENKVGLNSIGNIVLLVLGVNRSYGNDPHNEKMDRIISEFLINDWYIRPHTFNVFTSKIKSIDQNGENSQDMYWSNEDMVRTVQDIEKRLVKYLNIAEK
ncbi:MAG: DUF262 domain-containing protein [Bacteroidales bacterium]|nr:DUF262 domain-containing protein [Bacteroidales bacterium]